MAEAGTSHNKYPIRKEVAVQAPGQGEDLCINGAHEWALEHMGMEHMGRPFST